MFALKPKTLQTFDGRGLFAIVFNKIKNLFADHHFCVGANGVRPNQCDVDSIRANAIRSNANKCVTANIYKIKNPNNRPKCRQKRLIQQGFTLLELLLVIAIMAIASAGIALALPDSRKMQLEREGERLVALFESARAHSKSSGVLVQWQTSPEGFVFQGLSNTGFEALPTTWLDPNTQITEPKLRVYLGPEPVIGAQEITLMRSDLPDYFVYISTDGLRPFSVKIRAE